MQSIQNAKQQHNVAGILITDCKGFQIHNQGFTHPHHLHALKQLSQYFFPNQQGTIIGLETNEFTIVMRDTQEGNMVAMKEIK